MKMLEVDSSTVRSIGYEPKMRDMHVEFNSGGHYVYREVPQEVFDAFLNSPSKGRYLHQYIKGEYETERL